MSTHIDSFSARSAFKSASGAALSLAALLLSACDKTPLAPPTPMMRPAETATVPTAVVRTDASVPAAATVLTPAAAAKTDAAAGRTNRAMSPAQESSAMPLPGQNNDHSAPLTPAKRASGP